MNTGDQDTRGFHTVRLSHTASALKQQNRQGSGHYMLTLWLFPLALKQHNAISNSKYG